MHLPASAFHFGCYPFSQLPHSYREGEMPLREESLMLKELLPVVLVCTVWGRQWQRSVHCNNMGAVAVVNSGYSHVPRIMHLMRCLFFIRTHFEITLWVVHIPGKLNALADAISRNNLLYLFSQVQGAASGRLAILHRVLTLLVQQRPNWTSPAWTRLFGNCFLPG